MNNLSLHAFSPGADDWRQKRHTPLKNKAIGKLTGFLNVISLLQLTFLMSFNAVIKYLFKLTSLNPKKQPVTTFVTNHKDH